MVMQRWDPWTEMARVRRMMDRLFDESPPARISGMAGMDIDVLEQGDDLVVKATLPGVKPEDIDIRVENGALTIRGEVNEEQEKGEGRYLHRERRYGSFFRQIALPRDVDMSSCNADFENGVLTLMLPRAQHARSQRIPIRGGVNQHVVDAGSGQGRLVENKADTSSMAGTGQNGDAGQSSQSDQTGSGERPGMSGRT